MERTVYMQWKRNYLKCQRSIWMACVYTCLLRAMFWIDLPDKVMQISTTYCWPVEAVMYLPGQARDLQQHSRPVQVRSISAWHYLTARQKVKAVKPKRHALHLTRVGYTSWTRAITQTIRAISVTSRSMDLTSEVPAWLKRNRTGRKGQRSSRCKAKLDFTLRLQQALDLLKWYFMLFGYHHFVLFQVFFSDLLSILTSFSSHNLLQYNLYWPSLLLC